MSLQRVIIDVREPFEFASGHVDGAINIPPAELMAGSVQLAEVPKDAELIVYCRSGARSNSSIQLLRRLGFSNLVNGINAEQVEAKYL